MQSCVMPRNLKEDYDKEILHLFRIRINLYCYIAIGLFVLEVLLGLTFFKNLLNAKDIPGIAGGFVFSIVLLATAPLAKTLIRQKVRAFCFNVFLILVAILAAVAHPEIIRHMGIGLVLSALFPGVLLLPWNKMETLLIGAIAVINFVWVSRLSGTFLNDEIFAINVLLLIIAVIVCAIIKKSEDVLRRQDLVSRKEIEKKNSIMAHELELAREIHKSLVPRSIEGDLADVAVTYRPMFYMGGDYAKFHFIDKDKLVFMLVDVTGHGVSAALLVNRIHTEIERLLRERLFPGELLKQLEDFINRDFGKMTMLLTAFCGMLDFSSKRLIYSNHGHPPQILFQSSENKIVLMKSQTFLMGVGLESTDDCHNEIPFEEGDRIILFTDGITEARNDSSEMFGQERLEEFAKNNKDIDPAEFNSKLMKEIEGFQTEQEDDIFLITVQTKERS